MKKSDYLGWQDVFRFSFMQSFKQKAYVGFLIFMSVVTCASMPVLSLINSSKEEEVYVSEVETLTVYDETGLGIDYSDALMGEAFDGITLVTEPTVSYDEYVKSLETSEDSKDLVVRITFNEAGVFTLTFVKASGADLKDMDVESVSGTFHAYFNDARIKAIDVTDEQLAFIYQSIDTKVEFISEEGEIIPEEEPTQGITMETYSLLLTGIVVVTMIVSLSGSNVAMSIVTEKSTRVVEYLMIHVRPMALIVGKVLASLSLVMIQMGAIGISYLISCILNVVIFGASMDMGESMALTATLLQSMPGLNIGNIIIAVLIILLGVLFYAIIAGLAGASVSKLDELNEGLKLYQMSMVLGSYLSIAVCIVELAGSKSNALALVAGLIPFSAPFAVPMNLLCGNISVGVAIASCVISALAIAVLFVFTAKVYESLIFYNGKVLKFKDILQIAKNRNDGKKKGGN